VTKGPAQKTGELRNRWIVAIIGVPAVIGLLYVGGWALGGLLVAAAWIGAVETYRLAEQSGSKPFRFVGGAAATGLVLLAVSFPTYASFAPWALLVLTVLLVVSAFSAMLWRWPKGEPMAAVSNTMFGAMYAGLPLACIPLLHAAPTLEGWGPLTPDPWSGPAIVALPLAATWIGDAAAFFAGTKWGRSKILPTISPKKSWVGSWTGLLAAGAAAALWYVLAQPYVPGLPVTGMAMIVAVGVVLGAGAQIGDFFESLLKREAGVKDSGSVLPGHGGMLDRLDALTVTLPLTYAIMIFLEHFV
jgi:phosphatidate cytidylyltransferase